MSLSVFGAGWGRTGTSSLKLALEQLGFGPCHHMSEVMGNPNQMQHWSDIANNEIVDWNAVFDQYHSACDWPSSHYWRELAEFYPDAKIVLTTRPGEEWWKSYSNTIMAGLKAADEGANDPMLRFLFEISEKMFLKTANCRYDDKDKFIKAMNEYEGIVRDYFSKQPERLLVFSVKDGWEPLCEFLGVPVPSSDFPRTNDTEQFKNAQA